MSEPADSDRTHSPGGLGPAFVVVVCLTVAAAASGLALVGTIGKLRDAHFLNMRRFTACADQPSSIVAPDPPSATLRLALRSDTGGPTVSCAAADVRVRWPGPHCLTVLVHRREAGAAAVVRAVSDGLAAEIVLPPAPVGRELVLQGLEAENGLIDIRLELASEAPVAAVLELVRLRPCGGSS
jgi:hypothetical protein